MDIEYGNRKIIGKWRENRAAKTGLDGFIVKLKSFSAF